MAYAGPFPFKIGQGGTAVSSFTAYAPITGGTTTTGALQSASTGISTSGFVFTSTGATSLPTFQAIPFTQLPWTDESTTFSPAVGNGYFVTGNATATLPASPSQGNTIAFTVDGSVTLTITGNTGQAIQIGSAKSASAGTAVNAAATTGCSVTLVYRASDAVWFATSVIGTFTVT
jgi:hypothetical protein